MKHPSVSLILLFTIAFVFSACSGSGTLAPTIPVVTPTSKLSDTFKSQVTRILEEGATLTSLTEQGVNYADFGKQLVVVKGAYDLVVSMWPSGFADGAQQKFSKAIEGWDLALSLWGLKSDNRDYPVEPDINRYVDFTNYEGAKAYILNYGPAARVALYRNKNYLPFNENISTLFGLASNYFKDGRQMILAELP